MYISYVNYMGTWYNKTAIINYLYELYSGPMYMVLYI